MRKMSDSALHILKERYFLRNDNGEIIEDWDGLCHRVARFVSSCETDKAKWEEKFYHLLLSRLFLPNTPTLMNAGKKKMGLLHACYVIGITDDMESIADSWRIEALIGKGGGGIGYSFSQLRPKGDFINTSKGRSSGPISFMKVNDSVAEAVKQGGTRRIAQMGNLSIDHPDILDFIRCKEIEGEIKNFNISPTITDAFMQAVKNNEEYDLVNPRTKEIVGKLNAKDVFDELCERAWQNGEPGCIFIDTINKHHNLRKFAKIEATNPCGEQPLLPYEACVLGSIDLGKLVKKGKFNWDEFQEIVALATRFLDNTVTLSNCPIQEINEMVSKNRKIGLGVMGFADALVKLGIEYGSDESFNFAENIAKTIKETAHKTSVQLGIEKGLPENSVYYENTTPGTPYLEGTPRNSCQISYAPTGTIASIADASFGIEPLYDICFTKNILDGQKIFFVSDVVVELLKEKGFGNKVKDIESGIKVEELDIPAEIKSAFVTAYKLSPEKHIKMQASFQKYCDSAISKTINLPNNATIDDVRKAYMMAYDLGCKGITVYRDGSRKLQVVETGHGEERVDTIDRDDIVNGSTYRIKTQLGKLYFTVNDDNGKPIEVFLEMSNVSPDFLSLLNLNARLTSICFKYKVPTQAIVKQFEKIQNGSTIFYKGRGFKSIPDVLGSVLRKRFLSNETDTKKAMCDRCGSELIIQEGCEKCSGCGYSKC